MRQWIGTLVLHAPPSARSLRRIPVLGGLIHRVFERALARDQCVWAQVRSGPAQGIELELNPRTGSHYLRGGLELATQRVLLERLRPGMVFYDVGANIGLFSLLAARIVGPGGRVFSFEPDGEAARRLRRNIERNGFTNVHVVQAGVWSSTRRGRFAGAGVSSPDRGTGRVLGGEEAGAGVPISCVALDDFARTAGPPDGIKCDVEGAELEVLRGAEALLQSRRPWIVCETHGDSNAAAVREFLGGMRYRLEAVDDNHVLALP